MLPRAKGRSAGRLACLINFWAALQSHKRSKEKRKSWMGPDSAGTNGSSGVGIRPKTEPNCCSTPPHRWHQRSCPSGGRRQKQQSEMPVAAPACPRGKKTARVVAPAFLLFQPPLCHRPGCLQVLGAATEKGTCFDRCVADFLHD